MKNQISLVPVISVISALIIVVLLLIIYPNYVDNFFLTSRELNGSEELFQHYKLYGEVQDKELSKKNQIIKDIQNLKQKYNGSDFSDFLSEISKDPAFRTVESQNEAKISPEFSKTSKKLVKSNFELPKTETSQFQTESRPPIPLSTSIPLKQVKQSNQKQKGTNEKPNQKNRERGVLAEAEPPYTPRSLPLPPPPPLTFPFELPEPVLGPRPTHGAKPLFGFSHEGGDAVFALACNYPLVYYQRFVGSLRRYFSGDIVLAVSPQDKMKPGVEGYLREMRVLAYPFEVDCRGKDDCRFRDDFLGYPDPRAFRTFANLRYALYEYWLLQYDPLAYILILDFRDTFFQASPFQPFGPLSHRSLSYDLHLFAENEKVKTIGKCVYNSLWVGRCFGREVLEGLRTRPVICSGSTLGSLPSISLYVRTMLASMDTVRCWLKGIESDQGYQNVLYYHGNFTVARPSLHPQGEGVVNTIGAMNGFRVPKEMKGPLGSFWGARDEEGFVTNWDGNRSACVHQWDRWYSELRPFIDQHTYDK